MAKKAKGREGGASAKPKAPKTGIAESRISSDDLPRRSLEVALPIARLIRDTYAGKSASWSEIATALDVSASNNQNRYPVWAAVAYGIIRSEDNKYSVAEVGRKILAPNYEGEDREGMLKAILTPSVLARFYSDYNGSPLPAADLFLNVLENRYGIPRNRTTEARDIIVENARFAGILRVNPDGGMSLQFSLTGAPPSPATESTPNEGGDPESPARTDVSSDFSKACFVITPLGTDDSVERKHADAILNHLIHPVLKEFGIQAIRADKISKPGIITQQIIEQLARCKLCIADLSFNNPNAFYELGVRHTFMLPTIQIIKKGDKIPFDVSQGRTIIIDTADPYTIMDRFESARSELKEHVESCLSGADRADDNPIKLFLPGLRVTIP